MLSGDLYGHVEFIIQTLKGSKALPLPPLCREAAGTEWSCGELTAAPGKELKSHTFPLHKALLFKSTAAWKF